MVLIEMARVSSPMIHALVSASGSTVISSSSRRGPFEVAPLDLCLR